MKRRYSRQSLGLASAMAWLMAVGLPACADPTSGGGASVAPAAPAATGAAKPAAVEPVATATMNASGRISLEFKELDVEEAARKLGTLLGGEIRLEGPTDRKINLSFEEAPPRVALDQVARAMNATWKCTYRFTKGTTELPPPARLGLTVSLNLSDTSCKTGAIIAGKAAGGQVEGADELTGRVALVGKDLPVEDVMATIARAAEATWRPVYTFKLEAPTLAVPTPAPGETTGAVKPRERTTGGVIRRKPLPDVPLWDRNRGIITDPNGRRRFHRQPRERRTKFNQLAIYGARPKPKPPTVDIRRLEELSRLGAFGTIFAQASAQEREARIQRFRAALETQAERLASYKPEHRSQASKLTIQQLRGLLADAALLTEQQRKEIEPILEYVEQRLKELTDPKPETDAEGDKETGGQGDKGTEGKGEKGSGAQPKAQPEPKAKK